MGGKARPRFRLSSAVKASPGIAVGSGAYVRAVSPRRKGAGRKKAGEGANLLRSKSAPVSKAEGTEGNAGEGEEVDRNGAQDEKTTGTKWRENRTKHPLRVLGKRPGDGCFVCKGTDHIAKMCPVKTTRDKKKTCVLCRTVGHSLKNCPSDSQNTDKNICYNCGANGHRLADCKNPIKDGGASFAKCFVCKKKGHLSKNCPTNRHGIYPKGGFCKLCGEVTHLVKDCPWRTPGTHARHKMTSAAAQEQIPGCGGNEGGASGRRIMFQSGDGLEDDFVADGNNRETTIRALSFASEEEAGEAPDVRPTTSLPIKQGEPPSMVKRKAAAAPTTPPYAPKVIKFRRTH